jgi:hypothetical protein
LDTCPWIRAAREQMGVPKRTVSTIRTVTAVNVTFLFTLKKNSIL